MTPQKEDTTPYFFLVTKEYALGTPRGIGQSDRTMDISFHDLAKNYDLQDKLRLLSTVFIRPLAPWARPSVGQQLIDYVAAYLSAFCENPTESKQRREYLKNNGLVRILFTDDALQKEVMVQG